MTYKTTKNKSSYGFVPYIINIANELVKQAKNEAEISNTLESIPEWGKFQEGILKNKNDILVAPLGGRDPRTKIDSLFDDNDFLGRFKGFKPVPFESIKNRRKNMQKKSEIEMEQETEEEEEDDEDKLEMEDINQYYEDNDEVIELDLKDAPNQLFKSANRGENNDNFDEKVFTKGSKTREKNRGSSNRYSTIELDEDDDVEMIDDYYEEDREDDAEQKGLEWKIDPVSKEVDNERLIDDNIVDVAMEFIRGKTKNRGHMKNHDLLSKMKDFECEDDMLSRPRHKLNNDLKEIKDLDACGLPDIEDNSNSSGNNSEENIETNKKEVQDIDSEEKINEHNTETNKIHSKDVVSPLISKAFKWFGTIISHGTQYINKSNTANEATEANETNEIEDKSNNECEDKQYYDTEYWRDNYR